MVSHVNFSFEEDGHTSLSRVCMMVYPDKISPATILGASLLKDSLAPAAFEMIDVRVLVEMPSLCPRARASTAAKVWTVSNNQHISSDERELLERVWICVASETRAGFCARKIRTRLASSSFSYPMRAAY